MKNKTYLSDMAQKIQPYTWEFGSGKELRFNSNTLPYVPRSLKKFLENMEKNCPINEYADPNYSDLKKLLADYENVSTDQLTITNSGDEAIDIVAKTFLNPGDNFVVTPPTYEMFSIQCEINRGIPIEIPLDKETWEIKTKEIIASSKNPKTKIVFLCNPNNPTGTIIPPNVIEQVVKESKAIVVVDETYREFYGNTSVDLLKKYDNIVILRSFSKFAGIAGARIGYLIASKELSQKFDGIRFPMGVSLFSYKLAEEVLRSDRQWIVECVNEIKKEREKMKRALESFGFTVFPSETNFLLVRMGDRVKEIYEKLKQKNIYLRDRSTKINLGGCVRITVRSPKENKKLISEIKKIITSKNKYAFIDRDGTLIFEPQDTFQIDSLDKFKILDGVINGLKYLLDKGYTLVMVSNQDGLGTKSYPKESFDKVQKKLLETLNKNNIFFEEILICPHFADDNCNCRKPKTELVEKFIRNKGIDKKNSFVCGDRNSDKKLAENLGISYIAMKTNGNFYEAIKKEVRA